MARPALVIDASVGVKWFSGKDEASLPQALSLRDKHLAGQLLIVVPELFYYEVANAIVNKKFIPTDTVLSATAALFALDLHTVSIDSSLMESSIRISRQLNITIYDSCYMAIAQSNNCPLITANSRHQGQVSGCHIIPIEEWK